MKKKILSICISIFLLFIFMTLLQTNVLATTHTLEEIVEKFNNSSTVKSYKDYGYEIIATISEENPNILSITLTNSKNESSQVNYKLDGSILSYEHLTNDNIITASLLADAVGQVNGYKDGELFYTLNSEEIRSYTVENEGFEIKENGSYYSVKMDIDKKIPLVDLSKFYLKPDDFDIIKKFVDEGKTTGNQTGKKLKMTYNLILDDDENYIYIGEEDKTTESTYKSILSALEVMYGDKVVEYFKSIYPEISDGITMLEGFTIEVKADIDIEESPIFTGAEVVIVKIDNKYVNDEILRTEYIGETIKSGDKVITLDFTKDNSYKLNFFDSVSSSDSAFLYKYILEPIFIEADAKLEDNTTAYFNIANNGKIVVGDKNNSIFKIVVSDDYLEILPTKTDEGKTTQVAKHDNVKAKEYEEGKTQDHFRYLEYNVTVNIIYGKESTATNETKIDNEITTPKTTTSEKTTKKTNSPKTGDNVVIYITLFVISFAIIVSTIKYVRKD